MKKKVSVIIPNYNGLDYLKLCLDSLKKQTYKKFEIVVVDNGSTDGSVEYLTGNFPDIICIKLTRNFGYSEAVNTGIKRTKSRYVLLLNNDTAVDRKCLEYLVNSANDHPEAGFISAKILQFNDRTKIDNAGDNMDSSGHLLTRGFGKNERLYSKGENIFLGTGSGTLIKRKVFDKIGYFDEDYFFYMEDADFCFRAQLAGFKGWFEPNALIYHKRMGTAKKYIKNFEALVFRNLTMTIIKDFPKSLLLLNFNWLKVILVHVNTLRYLLFRGLFMDCLKVELFLLTHFVELLKKRKEVQSLKIVSDSYIISQIHDKKIRVGKLLSL